MNWRELKQWRDSLNNSQSNKLKQCAICEEFKHFEEFNYTPSSIDNRSCVCGKCKAYMDSANFLIKSIKTL